MSVSLGHEGDDADCAGNEVTHCVKLSVKVNNVFGDVPPAEMVERAAEAGADAVGFRPWFDDRLDEVVAAAADTGVSLSYLSGGSESTDGPAVPMADPGRTEEAVGDLRRAIDVAADAGAEFLNVIPGWANDTLDPAVQRRSVVDALRQVAERARSADVVLAVEPINTVDLPGIYLRSSYEGYSIVDAVSHSNVTLLYDCYHQQITEGNLIANLRRHVDEIGYVHIGDVPGRHEPGTGEINYQNVLSALAGAGYDGYVGCEFTPLTDPETAIHDVRNTLDSLDT